MFATPVRRCSRLIGAFLSLAFSLPLPPTLFATTQTYRFFGSHHSCCAPVHTNLLFLFQNFPPSGAHGPDLAPPKITKIMTLAPNPAPSSKESHSHNLSINSVSSIVEPTTPPSAGGGAPNSKLWDHHRLNGNLALPSFSLDTQKSPAEVSGGLHARQFLADSAVSAKNDETSPRSAPIKIDKDYLALVSKVPLGQLKPQILRLAKDQYGCRFLQKRIDENVVASHLARVANFDIIFGEIHPSLYELIIDPFGNYLVQKLVDYCSADDLDLMLETLQNNLFQISINQHGTRALQKVIDHMSTSHQLSVLMKGLKPYIIELIKDLNGNHVIQKILNKYPPDNCQFIYSSIIDDILVVATHKHGCCVLQKCLNHVNQAQLVAFSEEILRYSVFVVLINDQFGNYVLQYLILIDSISVNYNLYRNFLKYGINDLCNLKFSSNVVEKLMKNCYQNEVKSLEFTDLKFTIIASILGTDLNRLINDPYGNYVIQTLIDILINPNVSYYVDQGAERVWLPCLLQVLPPEQNNSPDSLQVQIIKHWFQNCKIVSSFGKRIQLKINIILNGVSKVSGRKYSQLNYNMVPQNMIPNQNMNANGEFVPTRASLASMKPQPNNMAANGMGYNGRGYNSYRRNQRVMNPLHQYYDGYAVNQGLSNNLGPSPVPRDPTSFESFANRSLSASATELLANLHISAPPSLGPIDHSNVSYNHINPTTSNFISNDFTRIADGYSMANPRVLPMAGSMFNGHYTPGNEHDRGQIGMGAKLPQYRNNNGLMAYHDTGNLAYAQNSPYNAYPGNLNALNK